MPVDERPVGAPALASQAVGEPILVVGAGSIGRRHLENLASLGVRDLVLYRSGRGGAWPAPPGVALARDLDAALALRPRAVLVCNPTALHVPVALAAARAGCSLFLEKPVSHTLDGVAELEAAVAAGSPVALVGFQFRYHPGLRQVKAWLDAGAIGDVVAARAHWGEHLPSWHPGEDYRTGYSARQDLGGGVVLTLSHPFDYLCWLLGDVVSVAAQVAQGGGLGLDVEDTAHVLLRFASGTLATITLDYVEQPPAHELHLTGRRGVIRWNNADGCAHLDSAGAPRRVSVAPPPAFTRNAMFVEEMRHFLACLAGHASPACTLADGVRALRVALAAKQAAEQRRSVDV